jgi:hypothetical protein
MQSPRRRHRERGLGGRFDDWRFALRGRRQSDFLQGEKIEVVGYFRDLFLKCGEGNEDS